MITVYGSALCPDCQEMKAAFDAEGVSYEYRDISADLRHLKAFLALRDSNEKFKKAKEKGLIGIPIVKQNGGEWTFHWRDFVKNAGNAPCESGVCGIGK